MNEIERYEFWHSEKDVFLSQLEVELVIGDEEQETSQST